MKVLYVTQYFSQEPTHASTVTTLEIVEGLARRGHDVGVISADSPGILRMYQKRATDARVVGIPLPEFNTQWYNGFTTFFTHTLIHAPLVLNALALNRFHDKFDAIISMYHPTHLATVSAYVLSRILKLPLVAKIHDFIIEAMDLNTLKRMYHTVLGDINLRFLRRSNAVLVQSPELKRVVNQQGCIESEKMFIFPNGVDTSAFRPGIESESLRKELRLEGKTVLLYLGGLYKYRHPELLIKALPNVIRDTKNLRTLFVGRGPEEPALSALAKRLGVSDYVGFIGSVKYSLVPRFISLADVTVGPLTVTRYPSIYGATPRTVAEYMACAKPVVVTRGAVSESTIIDGYNGMVVEPADVEGLSEMVVNLIEDIGLSRRIGQNAREHIEKTCSWKVLIARLESVLNSLVWPAN